MPGVLDDFLPTDVATLRQRFWPLLQTTLAATAAWKISLWALPTQAPTYTVLAIVTGMNVHPGHRGKWMLQVTLGAILGVLLANAVGMVPAAITVQILLVVFLALAVGVLFYSHNWFLINDVAGGVTPLASGATKQGFAFGLGWQALIALGVALLFTQLLFPADAAGAVRGPLAGLLRAAGRSLRSTAAGLSGAAEDGTDDEGSDDEGSDDEGSGTRADTAADEALDSTVSTLQQKITEGRHITRLAPRRFGQRPLIARYAAAHEPLSRLSDDLGGLVHLARRGDGDSPAILPGSCRDLAAVIGRLAEDVDDPARQEAVVRCADEIDERLARTDVGTPRNQAVRVVLQNVAADARDAARALQPLGRS